MREEKRLTREDVVKLIQENGGKAQGVDLSGKKFEEGIDLSGLDLSGIVMKNVSFPTHFESSELIGVKFSGSNLSGADLRNTNLQYAKFNRLNGKPACLQGVDFRGADLLHTDFSGADLSFARFGTREHKEQTSARFDTTDFRRSVLRGADFYGCHLYSVNFERAQLRGADIFDAHLEEVNWGNYVAGEEAEGDYYSAMHLYRRLKQWYSNKGMYDTAAKFYYREKEANRKSLKLRSKNWSHRLAMEFFRALFGYGEDWHRVVFWIAGIIFVFALVFFFFGGFKSFVMSLHFSAVSFIGLGYGSWFDKDSVNTWVQIAGVAESFVGFFMMTLLLIVFVRKWTR